MASKSMGGLVLLGIGALLVASVAAGDEKKTAPGKLDPDPEPKPAPPGPQPVAGNCTPTSPGDGPGNGKEAAVRAWQGCLVAAGCLAPDQIDGKHGPMTKGASELYASSGGKCAAPYELPKGGGGGGAAVPSRLYVLTYAGVIQNGETAGGDPASTKAQVEKFKVQAKKIAELAKGSKNGTYIVGSSLSSDNNKDLRQDASFEAVYSGGTSA